MGDGTGLVDPVTGEGIYYALKSARIAALALKRHLKHRRPLAQYNRMLRRYGDKIGAKHVAVYLGDLTYQELYAYVLSLKGFAYLRRPRHKTGRRT